MDVFVTGGTGLLGSNLVRHLVERGDRVRVLVRASSPGLGLSGLPVRRVRVDPFDRAALGRALRCVSGGSPCAGGFDAGRGGAERMHRVHVEMTRALIDAALEVGARRLLYVSSSITVGFGPREAPGDEDTPLGDLDALYGVDTPVRAYHDTKAAGEALVLGQAARGLEGVVVCPDYVLGPWDVKPASGAIVLAVARRRVPLAPPGGKCFVAATDCAVAMRNALVRDVAGRRFLLGAENRTYLEILSEIAEVVGRPPPRGTLPPALARAAVGGGRLVRRLVPGRFPFLDPEVLSGTFTERYRSGARARAELGLPGTPIRAAIQAAWDWFRAHGYAR